MPRIAAGASAVAIDGGESARNRFALDFREGLEGWLLLREVTRLKHQVPAFDDGPVRQDARAFKDVAEFADVSWPRPTSESAHRVSGKCLGRELEIAAETLE